MEHKLYLQAGEVDTKEYCEKVNLAYNLHEFNAKEAEKKKVIDEIQKLPIENIGDESNTEYKELDDKRDAIVNELNTLEE